MFSQDLASELKLIAKELRPRELQHLFSVIKTAEDVGTQVELHLHTIGKQREAQVDFNGHPPRIILFRPSETNGSRVLSSSDEHLLTARERFSIAHELGHFFAHQRFQLKPARESRKYWQQEAWMNEFASTLLVPDWLVTVWLSDIPEGRLISPLTVRGWAREQCKVSEEVIAKTLCRARKGIGFIKASLMMGRKDGVPILKTLFSDSGEGLFLPKVHSHIRNSALIKTLQTKKLGIEEFPGCQLGLCKPQDLSIAWRCVGFSSESSRDSRKERVAKDQKFWLSIAFSERAEYSKEGMSATLFGS